jgi:hypothetical protein
LGELVVNNGYVAGLAARHTAEAEDAPKVEPAPAKAKADDDTARQNAADDLNRPIGNWAVYNYYFTSIGRRNLVALMGLVICHVMCLQFPSKFF